MNTEQIQEQTQKSFSNIQDGISQLVDRAKPMANDVYNKSKELYNNALERLPENSEKYLAIAAVSVLGGIVGYQLGKKQRPGSQIMERVSNAASELKEDLSPSNLNYLTPALKFVKLWMFYRMSI